MMAEPYTAQIPPRRRPAKSGLTRKLRILLLAALLMLCAGGALADGLEGRFEMRSADIGLKDGVYHLNARIDLPVGGAVKRALAEGVPLRLDVELQIDRQRRFIPDATVAELSERYRLQFNAVSARYILRNENSGEQSSFTSVDEALDQLAQVRDVPVLDRALLEPDRHYEANVRAKMDFGTVPLTVRILMFWVSDWHRESEWYTWILQP
jgi:Domain of unknown function (DUF4390)